MTHYMITFDTNGWQTEFSDALIAEGWDDHYPDGSGIDRRLPNTTFRCQKFLTQSAAMSSVKAAEEAVRKLDGATTFNVTHFALGGFLTAGGGAARLKVEAKKVKTDVERIAELITKTKR